MFTDESASFRPPRDNAGFGFRALVFAACCTVGVYLVSELMRSTPTGRAPTPHGLAPATAKRAPAPSTSALVTATSRVHPTRVRESAQTVSVERATVYLCKNYGGGTFWSSASCNTQRATVDRMTSVPGNLPFNQQVAIASGAEREAAWLYNITPGGNAATFDATSRALSNAAECASIAAAILENDAAARQGQSASMQDWLRQKRMDLQSRRAALRC